MLCRGLPWHERVIVGVVVVLDVPARVGDLHAGVAAAVEPAVVGAGLVVVGHQARRHVHDLELLADRAGRALSGEEEGSVTFPVEECQLGSLLEEGGSEGETLLVTPALIVEDLRPEDEDGVGLRLDLDILLLGRQRCCWALAGGLQDYLGGLRAHEVHDLHQLPPPDAQELAQAGVVRVLRGVLRLLVVREGQAHECRCPLVNLLAEHVGTVWLDERRELRNEGVVLV
mmetsp:Transcript_118326/g.346632  ORF Transcript_118326/g.346632 Transcript_118326/m.346632 type:complete len:229 (+) Transcript_118326:1763-2449(+)